MTKEEEFVNTLKHYTKIHAQCLSPEIILGTSEFDELITQLKQEFEKLIDLFLERK